MRSLPSSRLVFLSNILVWFYTKFKFINFGSNKQPESCSFPIDIVYTWVDGGDADFLSKKSIYSKDKYDVRLKESDNDARYRQSNELLFSIRSVLLHANWVNKIYIVTDEQAPKWFVAADDRVKIVPHSTIFKDKSVLPVFNSHAIEANLHRIPGLSENFIYMNDDFFFRTRVVPSDFFSEDMSKTKFFLSSRAFIPDVVDERSYPVDIAARNNAQLLKDRYGYETNRKFQHTPMALKKSVLERFERENSDVFELTSSARFRSKTDYSIVSSLIHLYGDNIGTAESSSIPYFYVSFDDKLFELKMNILLLKRFKCFCINDVELENNNKKVFEIFENKMNLLFPKQSPYEK